MDLKTHISEVFWCRPKNHADLDYDIDLADISFGKEESNNLAWFDELLDGSLKIPESNNSQKRASTILFEGPPGSGKSTLSLQLAYKLMKQKKHVLYITTESSEDWLQQKVKSYGWDLSENEFHVPNNSSGKQQSRDGSPHIHILETNTFAYYLNGKDVPQQTRQFFEAIDGLIKTGKAVNNLSNISISNKHKKAINNLIQNDTPDILIIDSLNVIEPDKRADLFNRFSQLTHLGPELVITVLDSSTYSKNDSDYWAYLCDTIIRLDKKTIRNYQIRNIEVVKARYQSHIWGTHQLKIYGQSDFDNMSPSDKKRAHPYRKEGGIFIFPSIHYYLSKYKRKSPEEEIKCDETKLQSLNHTLNGGFPKHKCTGLVGNRGGHKSHLGYLHILKKVAEGECGLIISLRDDEGIAKTALNKILEQEFDNHPHTIDYYIKNGQLEILYYPPGYITPEEFFHKMFISIQRLKSTKKGITLLFNSLDQLGSRFPLCAEEKILIPGIIETLNAEDITSIFIGVQEPGQPPEQYGLLSMADLIINFNKRTFSSVDYYGHLMETHDDFKDIFSQPSKIDNKTIEAVSINIERFAGGQSPKSGGILELVDSSCEYKDNYNKQGLVYSPFSNNFSRGEIENVKLNNIYN